MTDYTLSEWKDQDGILSSMCLQFIVIPVKILTGFIKYYLLILNFISKTLQSQESPSQDVGGLTVTHIQT